MSRKFEPQPRTWNRKFTQAWRGIWIAPKKQNSFGVHGVVAVGVLTAAAILQATLTEWLILLLCIGLVLVTEWLNRSIEILAKAVTDRENVHVRDALDVASGAVLVAAGFASVVGGITFLVMLQRFWLQS